MKSYKLVNSEEIGHKLERLGINTYNYSSSHPFVFIEGKECSSFFMIDTYASLSKEEITQKDFLALPEPFKAGDWVKFISGDLSVIFKINKMNIEGECFWLEDYDRYFKIDQCTKLTTEQIEVLEL